MGGIINTTICGKTDVGLVRKNNEDMFLMVEPETGQLLDNNTQLAKPLERHGLLLVVSDGMGGYEGGEVASLLTVGAIKQELAKLPLQLSPMSRLEAAVEEANRVVWLERKANKQLREMGATATAVLVEQDIAYVAEVGDSRAYILRDGRIKQLTIDQTMIQMLVDSGAMTPEAAATSKNRNILLQAIGTHEYLQIAVTSIQIQANDILLLCSDGLTGKVQDSEIKEIIDRRASLDAATSELIELAKARGGDDNITVILAEFSGPALTSRPRLGVTLTKQIKVLARFDPEQEAQAKPKRQVRTAAFQDWLASAVIDAYARTPEQRQALADLENFGDYIVFRKGDLIISPINNPTSCDYYWLISGRYRVMIDTPKGDKQTIGLIVPPTDRRTDDDIQQGEPLIRVKRQFFVPSEVTHQGERKATFIRCDDEENVALKIPENLFNVVAEILGERFTTAVRYA